jgi:hypothetical protein
VSTSSRRSQTSLGVATDCFHVITGQLVRARGSLRQRLNGILSKACQLGTLRDASSLIGLALGHPPASFLGGGPLTLLTPDAGKRESQGAATSHNLANLPFLSIFAAVHYCLLNPRSHKLFDSFFKDLLLI